MIIKENLKKRIENLSFNPFLKKLLRLFNINTIFLNYHRVLSDENFLSGSRPDDDLVVSKSKFDEQISFIVNNYNPISINSISSNTKNKLNNIVITFDDGYLDNYENALPILRKYNCPAIIYITTSFIDNKAFPWWINIWKVIFSKEKIFLYDSEFDVSNLDKKRNFYKFVSKKFKLMKKNQQDIFFEEIKKKNGINILDISNDFLNVDQIKLLKNEKFIDIGCHTHFHQNLNILNDEEVKYEVEKSKKILSDILNYNIKHFSIPFGSRNTFSNKDLEIIKSLEFETIVTTYHGIFNNKNLQCIPRIGIGNNDTGSKLNSKLVGINSLINQILKR